VSRATSPDPFEPGGVVERFIQHSSSVSSPSFQNSLPTINLARKTSVASPCEVFPGPTVRFNGPPKSCSGIKVLRFIFINPHFCSAFPWFTGSFVRPFPRILRGVVSPIFTVLVGIIDSARGFLFPGPRMFAVFSQ